MITKHGVYRQKMANNFSEKKMIHLNDFDQVLLT